MEHIQVTVLLFPKDKEDQMFMMDMEVLLEVRVVVE
jgi:hypothetical protein